MSGSINDQLNYLIKECNHDLSCLWGMLGVCCVVPFHQLLLRFGLNIVNPGYMLHDSL